jgi:uncharacterized membrane protein YdjX (TVP38/TMEM64 family)
MRRYAVVYAGLLGAMLALFLLAEAFDVPLLADPEPLGGRRGALAGLTGVALLVVDVVLPVPSSVVMVAHGALFGIALGTALSMAGSLGAFAVAFALGRGGGAVVTRTIGEEERQRADRLVRRWGLAAIILSRPLPMLAETVAFAAGGSSLPWPRALGAAVLGSLPAAAVYAIAGAAAASFAGGAVVFVIVAVLALGAAVVMRPRAAVAEGRQR